MRVLHFYRTSFSDTHGGTEVFMNQLALAGRPLGIEAEVLSLSRDGSYGSDNSLGYTVHRVPRQFEVASNSVSLRAFSKFAELADSFDIIHYHFPWPFMDLVHFATRSRKPSIVTYHSDIIRQSIILKLYRPLMHKFLGSVDRIVSTSENYFRTSDTLQRFSSKVSVIPIGLDAETYPEPAAERLEYWRGRLGSKFFLFIGVLRYYKGLHILLEAARERDWPIVIVGAGPVEGELREEIARYSLTNIHLLGFVSDEDKSALYNLSRAVVFPSYLRSEAFGITLVEGAMYGRPLVSTEIGTGTSFVNSHNETGFVIPPSDAASLRSTLDVLWGDNELCDRLGAGARSRFEEHFTASQMAQSYLTLYQGLQVQGST
jgi:glycosyltransferase involved in cell wall biosynthesis